MCEIDSELTMNTLTFSGDFIANFKHISRIVQLFPLLTLIICQLDVSYKGVH